MSKRRTLLEDGTVKIIQHEECIVPRYTANIHGGNLVSQIHCELAVEDIKDNLAYIYCHGGRNNFKILTTEPDFVPEELSVSEDFGLFQAYIAKRYPDEKLNCYILMAYVHSGTSFYLSDDGHKVCQFDSGCAGFIAIRRDNVCDDYEDTDVAKQLTDAWEGDYLEYSVYDNLLDAPVEDSEITIGGSFTESDWFKESLKELEVKFNVDFSAIEVAYT